VVPLKLYDVIVPPVARAVVLAYLMTTIPLPPAPPVTVKPPVVLEPPFPPLPVLAVPAVPEVVPFP
jgi:hypothetical protein